MKTRSSGVFWKEARERGSRRKKISSGNTKSQSWYPAIGIAFDICELGCCVFIVFVACEKRQRELKEVSLDSNVACIIVAKAAGSRADPALNEAGRAVRFFRVRCGHGQCWKRACPAGSDIPIDFRAGRVIFPNLSSSEDT